MRIIKLQCDSCNGALELPVDDKVNYVHCPYCGHKYYLDDEKRETTINKNININKNVTHTEHYINEAEVIRAKSKDKNWKRDLLVGVAIPLAAILLFCGIFGIAKHSSNVEEDKLQAIVDEVMVDIENGDFEEAYIKANTLYYTSGWSSEIEEKWDNTRESLLKQIKKAEKEATGKDSIWGWFD